jgi:hypothetical protein
VWQVAAKLRKQLPGKIFQHKQSLRARTANAAKSTGTVKHTCQALFFYGRDIKDVTALRFR